MPDTLTSPLPVDAVLPELVDALRRGPAAILKAPPGTGKSTRVPGAILDAGLLGAGALVMPEPRRNAARAVAAAIAKRRGCALGGEVGYQVRFDRRASAGTRILVVTEGILTRRLIADPLLEGVSCVVLDEFHERSVHADLALAFLKELASVRDDLKIVVMSATIDAGGIGRYLGGAPIVSAEGRAFEVRVEHVPAPDDRPLAVRMCAGIAAALRNAGGGDVLAFLPGAAEIRATAERLEGALAGGGIEIAALYGALGAAEQDRALAPSARRRVVLATNIAETSLTIPGVTAVVDSGLVKRSRWDPRVGLDRLELGAVSASSAEQRAGRAGRVAPGYALRLWSSAAHAGLAASDEPEIRRIDPAPVLLAVLAFHPGDPRAFGFFEAPRAAAFDAGLELLARLGATAPGGFALTETGRSLAALPVHPRLGIILREAARRGRLERGALLAALLEERDVLERGAPAEAGACDLERRAELVERFGREGGDRDAARRLGLDFRAAANAIEAGRQLARSVRPSRGARREDAANLLLPGFPDRVCRRRRKDGRDALMVGGHGVRLSERSCVRSAELFLALAADAGARGERSTGDVLLASGVARADLESAFPWLVRTERAARFDPEREIVCATSRTVFDDLLIEERREERPDAEIAAALLAEAAAARFDDVFAPAPDAARLLSRLAFAAAVLPEESWPDVSRAALAARLPAVCRGLSSFAELRRVDWGGAVQGELGRRARGLLDEEVPDRLAVPSGRRVPIDYAPALAPCGSPVLAVRIQELFGLRAAPRIARGRAAIAIHLLAPSGRPVQVTTDLESFWRSTYPEVRKRLRARYPKHDWPEDPTTAAPTARPGRREKRR
ncbi:MAG: ATP-dependent helicase HrpB [Proteobacteria bacterium]|jgi:ATP-dependent helicase HrpB|nr:ATP-dependent helicase HrpB [Pseudomonadota bacterium]